MNTTNTPASSDDFERDKTADEPRAESAHDTRRLPLDATTLVPLGIVAAFGLGVILQSPEVRKACSGVLQDPEVIKTCREAGKNVCREVAASWRRNNGTGAILGAFRR